jgi:hypothetical protein
MLTKELLPYHSRTLRPTRFGPLTHLYPTIPRASKPLSNHISWTLSNLKLRWQSKKLAAYFKMMIAMKSRPKRKKSQRKLKLNRRLGKRKKNQPILNRLPQSKNLMTHQLTKKSQKPLRKKKNSLSKRSFKRPSLLLWKFWRLSMEIVLLLNPLSH